MRHAPNRVVHSDRSALDLWTEITLGVDGERKEADAVSTALAPLFEGQIPKTEVCNARIFVTTAHRQAYGQPGPEFCLQTRDA